MWSHAVLPLAYGMVIPLEWLYVREFTTNVGPVMSEAAKKKGISASVVVREVMSLGSETGVDTEESHSDVDQKRSTLLKKFSASTIKSILELLCDESVRPDTGTYIGQHKRYVGVTYHHYMAWLSISNTNLKNWLAFSVRGRTASYS